MTPSINPSAPASPAAAGQASSGAASSTAAPPAPVTENMFLKLLVAQLQNQDPLNPTDSTQFVTQLAQFQQMEQSMNMGQDLSAIRRDVDEFLKTNSSTATQPSA